jgi:hypothetical protein
MRMANLVMAMAAVLLLVTVVMMGTTVGWKALAEDVDKIPLVSSLDGLKQSNLVSRIAPPLNAQSVANQAGRSGADQRWVVAAIAGQVGDDALRGPHHPVLLRGVLPQPGGAACPEAVTEIPLRFY